jgi:hypothetical protein
MRLETSLGDFDIEQVLPIDQRNLRLMSALRAWRELMPDDLLRAAVLEPDRAFAAFERARGSIDLANKAHEQILPQVHFSIGSRLIGDPIEPLLKMMRVQNAFKNQLILRQLGTIARQFEDSGVDFLILRGAALALAVYPHPSCRSVRDIDFLVREVDFDQTTAHLAQLGWSSKKYVANRDPTRKFYSTTVWKHDNYDVSIDLHAVMNRHSAWQGIDDIFWERTATCALDGVNIQTLSSEDHLLQVCVNGLRRNPPLRWAVDAHWLLKGSENRFDWDRLIATAEKTHSSIKLTVALGYLQGVLDADIPSEVSRRLSQAAVQTYHIRFFAYRLGSPEGNWSKSARYWKEFRECYSEIALLPALLYLPAFLRDKTGGRNVISANWRILVYMLKNIWPARSRRDH